MENASTALLMAGGMLLAVIVISLFVLGYSNITNMQQAKVDAEMIAEIEEYNKQFLVFNKKAMYGTDIISILNLAISNNKINNVKYGQELYIDVSFKLTKDAIQDTEYKYTLNEETAIYKTERLSRSKALYVADFSFDVNKTYSLSQHLGPITAFLQTANVSEETKVITAYRGATVLEYRVKYSGIADFKRKTFKCSKIEYDSNGRINALRFEQIQESVYNGGK